MSIDYEQIDCILLRRAISAAVDERLSQIPDIPPNIVVPGGEENNAVTRGGGVFRGTCGNGCEKNLQENLSLMQ